MATLTILTNASQGTDVTIGDMGITIANSGGSETFTDTNNLEKARLSPNLRTLVTDDAHGANSSTLILNNGTDNIAQASVVAFLDSINVPLLHNFAGTTAPAVTDDSGDGYSVGSRWVDTTNGNEYVCLDNTLGAAVWRVGGFNNNNLVSVSAADTITTTSITYVDATTMTLTPGAGTYWVTFSATGSMNKNAQQVLAIIAGNGVTVSSSERELGGQADNFGNFNSQGEVTVAAAQAITAQWRITSATGGGTGTLLERTLMAIRTS
jgi:hypothetical protein